ncbi:enoyl-CoA hydratase-related protein [Novosphingobium sp. BL-52-GroH]|uniref:enoyl-CoA hydratase-related protein n=1 Tax=Novosphingobium sp. BL-52-GroH TaxID=3349877 RepID=UPI00384ED491
MSTNTEAAKPATFELVDDHIAVITLNRPEKRNAINGEIARLVDGYLKEIESNVAIRVAILASSLEAVFCAGADIKEMAEGRGHELATPDGGFAGLIDARRRKPLIAAVRGAALGGGCELALACDMIVASDDASFGLPEVKRGLFAGAGGVHRLPRALPRNVALELIATGEPMSAADARAFGLVNRVVPSGKVLDTALALARTIAANAPLSVTESLVVARQASEQGDADLRALSVTVADRVFASEDAQEGPRAFLEKRVPQWQGR